MATVKIKVPEGFPAGTPEAPAHPGYLTVDADAFDPATMELLDGEVLPEKPKALGLSVADDPGLAEAFTKAAEEAQAAVKRAEDAEAALAHANATVTSLEAKAAEDAAKLAELEAKVSDLDAKVADLENLLKQATEPGGGGQ